MNQGAGQGEFFLHPSGESTGKPGVKRGEPGEIQQFLAPFLEIRDPVQLGKKLDVFINGKIAIEREVLREITDLSFDLFRAVNRSYPST